MSYEDKALTFGNHKDELICDIDSSYLKWLLETDWFEKVYPELVPFVEDELKYRKKWDVDD